MRSAPTARRGGSGRAPRCPGGLVSGLALLAAVGACAKRAASPPPERAAAAAEAKEAAAGPEDLAALERDLASLERRLAQAGVAPPAGGEDAGAQVAMETEVAPTAVEESPAPPPARSQRQAKKAEARVAADGDDRASGGRCQQICDLAEAICDLEGRICGLAARHGGQARYEQACARAEEDCARASEACRGCA